MQDIPGIAKRKIYLIQMQLSKIQHKHMMLANDWRLRAQLRDKVINQLKNMWQTHRR